MRLDPTGNAQLTGPVSLNITPQNTSGRLRPTGVQLRRTVNPSSCNYSIYDYDYAISAICLVDRVFIIIIEKVPYGCWLNARPLR